jgi:hypothetical protein
VVTTTRAPPVSSSFTSSMAIDRSEAPVTSAVRPAKLTSPRASEESVSSKAAATPSFSRAAAP